METAANTPSPHSSGGPGPNDPTPEPAQPAILDVEQLEQLRELPGSGDGTLLDDLIEIVRRDVPPDLARLLVLVQQRAGTEVAQLAHRVAGSAASLGAVALRRVLHELEQAGRKSDWPVADRVVVTLEREWQATLRALQMSSGRPPP
jgi:HPt (histidine-containing phosphotransfer) domain-containing protein